MPGRRLHSLGSMGVVALAVAGAATLGVAPVITPGLAGSVRTVLAEAALLDTESWIMGGSGLPIPPPSYLEALSERYINPSAFPDFSGGNPLFQNQPEFPVTATNPLFTPEGLYPFTGVKNLELDPSVAQGVSILNSTINDQIAADNNLVVLGYSQSATINSLEMKNLLSLDPADQPTAAQLAFILLGDPSNPDGGLLSRFDLTTLGQGLPQLTIPSLGVTFSGATPSEGPWDTAIYTQEYDGFADFPKYPLNFLSDLNALLGIMTVHGTYPSISAEKIGTAMLLPGSADNPFEYADGTTTAADATNYYMIPTETLPLLAPLKGIPLIGQPLYDLLEPDMRILVNLGYGSIDSGWDQGPANLPTPFGLFPDVDSTELMTALSNGAKDGWEAFLNDFAHPSVQALSDPFTFGAAASFTDIVNAFSAALSSAYAALLPTADIFNSLVTTLPTYDIALFTHYLEAGDLINAIGMPLAANTGLVTLSAGFELIAVENAVKGIQDAFSGLG